MAPPATTATAAVQKEILAAIQRLSEQLAAQGLTDSAAMELRFVNQDELTSLRANKRLDPLAARLDSIDNGQKTIITRLDALNGTVRRHDTELAIMQTFCNEQVKPALLKVENMRLDIKGLMVQAGGTAAVISVLYGIAKAAGWL